MTYLCKKTAFWSFSTSFVPGDESPCYKYRQKYYVAMYTGVNLRDIKIEPLRGFIGGGFTHGDASFETLGHASLHPLICTFGVFFIFPLKGKSSRLGGFCLFECHLSVCLFTNKPFIIGKFFFIIH